MMSADEVKSMQELSKKILADYQIRKTRKQKTEFIEMLTSALEAEGHSVRVEKSGLFRSRNIVVGDLENSKMVLSAHYDTAPVLPFPNFLAPKNLFVYLLYVLALIAVLSLAEFLIGSVVYLITDSPFAVTVFLYGVLAFVFGWTIFGKANKRTANDNTSGVITLVEALANENLKDQICCVFFDHEEVGLFGSMAFAGKHKKMMKQKLLMNFDCVGDGNHLMLVVNRRARGHWRQLEEAFLPEGDKQVIVTNSSTTMYPSDQANFKKTVGVAVFKKHKLFGYYMNKIHTKQDVNCDMRNIELIVRGLRRFLNGI